MSVAGAAAQRPAATTAERRLPPWWPLAALIVLAAALRLATLSEQSFWYDEAFTPVHVLHGSLRATLHSLVHSENTPPLWYLLAWVDTKLLGDGALALRLPSALAGIATVPLAWAVAGELAGRRAALISGAIVAVNPLFVWYSQEARAYGLFVMLSALAMLCFVRALKQPTRGRMAAFALSGALALLSHYFAVFLLAPMALWLLRERATRRAALPALGTLGVVGLALLPLISAQGGHGTQWIGRWALSSRLQAIPQYFLTGYSGGPLGHGVELLVALPLLAGVVFGGWRLLLLGPGRSARPDPRRGAWIALSIAGFGVLAPILLAALGADYLAPRNLVGAMIPFGVLVAILLACIDGPADGPATLRLPLGAILTGLLLAAFLTVSIDVDLSPRLQRGNWRDVAKLLRAPAPALAPGAAATGGTGVTGEGATGESSLPRVLSTVELGAAPLEYYLPQLHLRNLSRHATVLVQEIDESGYAPLREGAADPPAPGFRLVEHRDIDGLIVYRFVSSVPRPVSEVDLRRHVITLAHPEVLVPGGASAPVRRGA